MRRYHTLVRYDIDKIFRTYRYFKYRAIHGTTCICSSKLLPNFSDVHQTVILAILQVLYYILVVTCIPGAAAPGNADQEN